MRQEAVLRLRSERQEALLGGAILSLEYVLIQNIARGKNCTFFVITLHSLYLHFSKKPQLYRVAHLTAPPVKVLSVRLHSESHQKISKCQNLLTSWHLEILGGGAVK